MGIGSRSEIVGSRIAYKENDDVIEINSLLPQLCDNTESLSIDYLFEYIIPERESEITIDITKISVLDLSHCNLTALPIDCKKLNLKHLGLAHNELKEVPLCLYSGLKYLESLDLSYNSIELFDMEPECLPYIKIIKLNNNKFENVPKWFLMFKCTNLEEFNYSHNKSKHYKYLKGSINISRMKLQKLELINSRLIDEDYSLLKCYKFLKFLDISNEDKAHINTFNELDELFVKPHWKELTVLKLNSLSLSIFPEGIAWMCSLAELYITDNSLSWLPDGLQYLINLEVLDISCNGIIAIPEFMLSLQRLRALLASDNFIQVVPDFAQMNNLKTLDLYHNSLDEITFNFTSIDSVDLEYNYYDTKGLENYCTYKEKVSRLRKEFRREERYNAPKIFEEQDSISPATSDSEENYEKWKGVVRTVPIGIEETENWDLPAKVKLKNPEIDSIDDEWQGEDNNLRLSKSCESKTKIYISDDDWMFVDCENVES
ncbi:hypothetical protein NQ317_015702 [Molorchus minor]|uniref:Uncharacterized protein n=1 Tax=Molorchus minor TaxID=1323400 RepID=A0ABQ9J5R3_9CUCU|nr:hypothetical protein NQ317_015702 [Molorchus minor]